MSATWLERWEQDLRMVAENELFDTSSVRPLVEAARRLTDDNARLRALVKDVEREGCIGRDSEPGCPWCGGEVVWTSNGPGMTDSVRVDHPDDCPAFTPEGVVK